MFQDKNILTSSNIVNTKIVMDADEFAEIANNISRRLSHDRYVHAPESVQKLVRDVVSAIARNKNIVPSAENKTE